MFPYVVGGLSFNIACISTLWTKPQNESSVRVELPIPIQNNINHLLMLFVNAVSLPESTHTMHSCVSGPAHSDILVWWFHHGHLLTLQRSACAHICSLNQPKEQAFLRCMHALGARKQQSGEVC